MTMVHRPVYYFVVYPLVAEALENSPWNCSWADGASAAGGLSALRVVFFESDGLRRKFLLTAVEPFDLNCDAGDQGRRCHFFLLRILRTH